MKLKAIVTSSYVVLLASAIKSLQTFHAETVYCLKLEVSFGR